ncbi:MAG: LysR substrate-binding domain-containing protein, partial [Planifilum fulgidum]
RPFLPAVEVDHMSLLLRWIQTGEGVGFLLKSIAEEMAAAGKLKVLPFRPVPPLPGIPVYLVLPKRKRSSGGLETLANHLLRFFNKAQ